MSRDRPNAFGPEFKSPLAHSETPAQQGFLRVQLDLTQADRKGRNYDPSEWFVVPFKVIDQAIDLIMSGDIVHFVYDAEVHRLVKRDR